MAIALRTAPRFPAARGSLAASFALLDRADLEAIAEAVIGEMDRRDPDADLELHGDEADGNGSEDDFMHHGMNWLGEAGCPVSDPGGEEQSNGPTNGRDGCRQRHQEMRA